MEQDGKCAMLKERWSDTVENYEELLTELNASIWDYAELKFGEFRSAQALEKLLEQNGFEVRSSVAGMETAFTATCGSGSPVIGILAEYDALSGLSQEAGETCQKPREGTDNGHGCGHCLLGTASVGAALIVKDYLEGHKKNGTVVLAGCPAEEGGSGKAYMARAGIFDRLDIALTWHPGGGYAVLTGSLQANCQAYFRFKGVSSHAAGAPHLGRSALDALELMDVGVNYMREHMEPVDRIHYAITDTGGSSPNVVQNHAEVLYLIRSENTEKVRKLYERVCKIARGAAMMTETAVEIVFDKACSNTISNEVLEQLLYESMERVPLPVYSEEELKFAAEMKKTITDRDIESDLSISFMEGREKRGAEARYRELVMSDFVVPHRHREVLVAGSSDVGDVSHTVPTAQFIGGCFVPGTPAHSWQMVSQSKSETAVKGMLYAARVLADAAIRVIEDPQIAVLAREEFKTVTEGKAYCCPIPPDVLPNMNSGQKTAEQPSGLRQTVQDAG